VINLVVSVETGRGTGGGKIKQAAFVDGDHLLTLAVRGLTLQLAKALRERVTSGRDPGGGRWSARGTYSTSDGRFWVPPSATSDQRPAHLERQVVQGGRWNGWAIYPSYRAYVRALGQGGKARNYIKTGQLMASMQVVMDGPASSRVTFKGSKRAKIAPSSHRKLVKLGVTGKKLKRLSKSSIQRSQQAWIASSQERYLLMAPSSLEVDRLLDSAAMGVVRRFEADVDSRQALFAARSDLSKVGRKAARLQKRVSRIIPSR